MRLAHFDVQRERMDRRCLGHSKTAFFKVEFLNEVGKIDVPCSLTQPRLIRYRLITVTVSFCLTGEDECFILDWFFILKFKPM